MSDTPLEIVAEIAATRPALQPNEWEIVAKATDWMKATLKPEVKAELDIEYAKKYEADMNLVREEARKYMDEQMEAYKKDQKPLDHEELQMMLTQKYVSFSFELQERKNKEMVTRHFTLVELPQEQEAKFVKLAQQNLLKFIEEAQALDFSKLSLSSAEQLQMVLQSIPAALNAAAEIAAICLNPWGDEPDITTEWVKKNLSTYRIQSVIISQGEVNKYRNFLSNGFRLYRTLKMG